MAELLSQNEIDALLNNVKSGTTDNSSGPSTEKEAVPFDFRLPNRISKNQLRTMRNIHEIFAESFTSFLVSKLQTIVNVNVVSVDQIYYSEYVLSVSNPSYVYTFEMVDTDIKAILELSPELGSTLVERLLGGAGDGEKESNVITPIEQKVMNVVVDRIMLDLKKSWATIDNYEFKVDRFEPDIDFAQITSPNESALMISFEIILNEKSYLMNLCFATYAFDTVISKLSTQKLSSIRPFKYRGTSAQEIISSNLKDALVPVTVQFGTSTITMKELTELNVGDILKLYTKIGDENIVKLGNKILFAGRPGVVNNKKSVRITRKLYS
ncbi:MAG: flagellar motor switch protein FliM [Melioribacteraceae bacterium]|nr:flagellar motor switch protein FliM [Melioribacteraceae bacterium]